MYPTPPSDVPKSPTSPVTARSVLALAGGLARGRSFQTAAVGAGLGGAQMRRSWWQNRAGDGDMPPADGDPFWTWAWRCFVIAEATVLASIEEAVVSVAQDPESKNFAKLALHVLERKSEDYAPESSKTEGGSTQITIDKLAILIGNGGDLSELTKRAFGGPEGEQALPAIDAREIDGDEPPRAPRKFALARREPAG